MEGSIESRFKLREVEARKSFLEDYVGEAIELYKDKDYQSVINHLRDKRAAEWSGFMLDEDVPEFVLRKTPNEEEVDKLVALIAYRSFFKYGPKKSGEIRISNFFVIPPEGQSKEDIKIPERLWQEVSLVHLEEWIHGLQHLSNGTLTGADDREKDIPRYLKSKGVEVTDWFMKLHQ